MNLRYETLFLPSVLFSHFEFSSEKAFSNSQARPTGDALMHEDPEAVKPSHLSYRFRTRRRVLRVQERYQTRKPRHRSKVLYEKDSLRLRFRKISGPGTAHGKSGEVAGMAIGAAGEKGGPL